MKQLAAIINDPFVSMFCLGSYGYGYKPTRSSCLNDVILMKKNVFFNYTSITFLVDKIIKLISLLYAKFYKENYFINLYYDSKLIKEKQI